MCQVCVQLGRYSSCPNFSIGTGDCFVVVVTVVGTSVPNSFIHKKEGGGVWVVVREGRIQQLVHAFQCKGTRHHVITPPPRQSAVLCPAGAGKDIVSYAQSTMAVTSGRRWLGQERTLFLTPSQPWRLHQGDAGWDRKGHCLFLTPSQPWRLYQGDVGTGCAPCKPHGTSVDVKQRQRTTTTKHRRMHATGTPRVCGPL